MNNQELKIEKQSAIDAYKNADANGKALLKNLFPNVVLTGKITDHIKTLEDACKILGIDVAAIKLTFPDNHEDVSSIVAYSKLIIIAKALNEGWQPDWSNSSQAKWVPWFTHKSGFGLSLGGVAGWTTNTYCGSRLCYKTKELAQYAATQFADEYNDFLTIKQ